MPEIEIPEIREIALPLPPDTSWSLYVWVLIALIILLLFAFVLALVLIRKSAPTEPGDPPYDPRQSALGKLLELNENYLGLPAGEFAFEASHAMREYLTAFYGPITPFETGSEFLRRQRSAGLMDERKFGTIRDLYERAETLKYAPAPGADSQRQDLVQDMMAFVLNDSPGPKLQPPSSDADAVLA